MSVSLSALETRLQNRLGFTSLSTLQSSQIREALNASVGRALTDGVPGLNRTFVSCTLGEFTAAVVTMTSGNDYLESNSGENFVAAGVLPGDILILDGSRELLVHRIESTDTDRIYVGSRLEQTYTSVSLTIWRRSLSIPTSGKVLRVRDADTRRSLVYDPEGIEKVPFARGTAQVYTPTNNAEGSGERLIALTPCPSEVTDFVVTQAYEIDRLTSDGDLFEIPEGVIDAVLTRAVRAIRGWTSNDQIEQVVAESEVKDADDQLLDRDGGRGFFVK